MERQIYAYFSAVSPCILHIPFILLTLMPKLRKIPNYPIDKLYLVCLNHCCTPYVVDSNWINRERSAILRQLTLL